MKPPSKVIVSLSPKGTLRLELDGPEGRNRVVEFRKLELVGELLVRILEAKTTGDSVIGSEAAPTQHQVRHWEMHQVFPDARCPFCQSESRDLRAKRLEAAIAGLPVTKGKGKAPKSLEAKQSAEDLGL